MGLVLMGASELFFFHGGMVGISKVSKPKRPCLSACRARWWRIDVLGARKLLMFSELTINIVVYQRIEAWNENFCLTSSFRPQCERAILISESSAANLKRPEMRGCSVTCHPDSWIWVSINEGGDTEKQRDSSRLS